MASELPAVSVSEFVALANQTLEFAYPQVLITGELANFRVSKNRWVYFDLKDAEASVKFFGTVYQLPGPLEDGMMVTVRGAPRLHPLYGFSITIQSITPTGEGTIKKAAALLQAKLQAEGVFDEARKRALPYPPKSIGLITSGESAACRDFMKIITARWGGVHIRHIDVQVQGDAAVGQVAAAIDQLNRLASPPEVIVITRGGGSAEDLQAFSTEQVTRAVAASRVPTLVAIGHEIDISLAELAADVRASTPSNAAELLVPDRAAVLRHLRAERKHLYEVARHTVLALRTQLEQHKKLLAAATQQVLVQDKQALQLRKKLLEAYNPHLALTKGYALVRLGGTVIRSGAELTVGDTVELQFADSRISAKVEHITQK